MDKVFSKFSRDICKCLSNGSFMTEATLRCAFCIALRNSTKIKIHEILLEYPQKKLNGKKEKGNRRIDMYIPSLNGKRMTIEFKYDRGFEKRTTPNTTQNAVELFADIYRLSKLANSNRIGRLMVYCTDKIMANYFRESKKCFSEFFHLKNAKKIKLGKSSIKSKSKALKKVISSLSASIVCLWSENLPNDHYLRIYKVIPH